MSWFTLKKPVKEEAPKEEKSDKSKKNEENLRIQVKEMKIELHEAMISIEYLKKRVEDFHIIAQELQTRDTDAIRLKNYLEKMATRMGYDPKKIQDY